MSKWTVPLLPPDLSKDDLLGVYIDWTGTGKRFDVKYTMLNPSYKTQLKKHECLGTGYYGQVFKVVYRRVDLARKSIRIVGKVSKTKIEQLREECIIGQMLERHHHIIKVVGTFWKDDNHYNILTYPVAVCNLGQLLDDCQAFWPINERRRDNIGDIRRRLDGLGLGNGFPDVDDYKRWVLTQRRLRQIMGCLTQGIIWMHSKGIYHRDLKPGNILLHVGKLFLTDFGLSRNGNEAENSTTECHVGHSRGYAAPEVINLEAYNPQQADIYSLGCIFLHILTIICKDGVAASTPGKSSSLQQTVRLEHFLRFLEKMNPGNKVRTYEGIPEKMVTLLAQMLAQDRKKRPHIEYIDSELQQVGQPGDTYYGPCCSKPETSPSGGQALASQANAESQQSEGNIYITDDSFSTNSPKEKIGLPVRDDYQLITRRLRPTGDPQAGLSWLQAARSIQRNMIDATLSSEQTLEGLLEGSKQRTGLLYNASRVKVAVLDSCLDIDSKVFDPYRGRIQGFKNFANGTRGAMRTDTSDATCVASLLLHMAPDADVYVGQAFESTGSLINAIQHATDVWKVDIISISGGCSRNVFVREMETALYWAHYNNISVFAASGHQDQCYYPARYETVYSVSSTNYMGNLIPSTPPSLTGMDFATLGENIAPFWVAPLALDKYDLLTTMSGSSFSTPIAVGIFATTLFSARLVYHGTPYTAHAKLLNTHAFKDRLLRALSIATHSGFHYVGVDEAWSTNIVAEVKRIVEDVSEGR